MGPARAWFARAVDIADALPGPDSGSADATLVASGPGACGPAFAFFSTSGYTTAQNTGALGLMDYDEVVRYADAYELQSIFVRIQDGAQKDVTAAEMLAGALRKRPNGTQVNDTKRQLRLALGDLLFMAGVAKTLDARYARAIGDGTDLGSPGEARYTPAAFLKETGR